MATPAVSKEEERKLNERIIAIRKKNAIIEQRHNEVENDKKKADELSSSITMKEVEPYIMSPVTLRFDRCKTPVSPNSEECSSPKLCSYFAKKKIDPPPDPLNELYYDPDREIDGDKLGNNAENHKTAGDNYKKRQNYTESGAKSKQNSISLKTNYNNTRNYSGKIKVINYRGNPTPRSHYRGRRLSVNYNWNLQSSSCTAGKETTQPGEKYRVPTESNIKYDMWKSERNKYDEERIARAKKSDGGWKREWDNHKIGNWMKKDIPDSEGNKYERRFSYKVPEKFDRSNWNSNEIENQSDWESEPRTPNEKLGCNFNQENNGEISDKEKYTFNQELNKSSPRNSINNNLVTKSGILPTKVEQVDVTHRKIKKMNISQSEESSINEIRPFKVVYPNNSNEYNNVCGTNLIVNELPAAIATNEDTFAYELKDLKSGSNLEMTHEDSIMRHFPIIKDSMISTNVNFEEKQNIILRGSEFVQSSLPSFSTQHNVKEFDAILRGHNIRNELESDDSFKGNKSMREGLGSLCFSENLQKTYGKLSGDFVNDIDAFSSSQSLPNKYSNIDEKELLGRLYRVVEAKDMQEFSKKIECTMNEMSNVIENPTSFKGNVSLEKRSTISDSSTYIISANDGNNIIVPVLVEGSTIENFGIDSQDTGLHLPSNNDNVTIVESPTSLKSDLSFEDSFTISDCSTCDIYVNDSNNNILPGLVEETVGIGNLPFDSQDIGLQFRLNNDNVTIVGSPISLKSDVPLEDTFTISDCSTCDISANDGNNIIVPGLMEETVGIDNLAFDSQETGLKFRLNNDNVTIVESPISLKSDVSVEDTFTISDCSTCDISANDSNNIILPALIEEIVGIDNLTNVDSRDTDLIVSNYNVTNFVKSQTLSKSDISLDESFTILNCSTCDNFVNESNNIIPLYSMKKSVSIENITMNDSNNSNLPPLPSIANNHNVPNLLESLTSIRNKQSLDDNFIISDCSTCDFSVNNRNNIIVPDLMEEMIGIDSLAIVDTQDSNLTRPLRKSNDNVTNVEMATSLKSDLSLDNSFTLSDCSTFSVKDNNIIVPGLMEERVGVNKLAIVDSQGPQLKLIFNNNSATIVDSSNSPKSDLSLSDSSTLSDCSPCDFSGNDRRNIILPCLMEETVGITNVAIIDSQDTELMIPSINNNVQNLIETSTSLNSDASLDESFTIPYSTCVNSVNDANNIIPPCSIKESVVIENFAIQHFKETILPLQSIKYNDVPALHPTIIDQTSLKSDTSNWSMRNIFDYVSGIIPPCVSEPLECQSSIYSTDKDEQDSISSEDVFISDEASSEASSIYEPAYEYFLPEVEDFSTSDSDSTILWKNEETTITSLEQAFNADYISDLEFKKRLDSTKETNSIEAFDSDYEFLLSKEIDSIYETYFSVNKSSFSNEEPSSKQLNSPNETNISQERSSSCKNYLDNQIFSACENIVAEELTKD